MSDIDVKDEHGDGTKPRMFTDGTHEFKAMRYGTDTFTTLIDWLGSVGFESAIDNGWLVIREGFPDGRDMAIAVTAWVAMFPRLTVWSREEFLKHVKPAVMCGYSG